MARYFDVHPDNPQARSVTQLVALLREGGLIAYPTDSGYALGATFGNAAALARIRDIRALDERHHFTLVCKDFAQMGPYVQVSNAMYRTVKACTPGAYTFVVPASREVPRRLQNPTKRTVGIRIPDHTVVRALLAELGEPLASSTLLLPGEDRPMTDGWEIKERLDHLVDAVVDSGECGADPTTVVDLSGDEAAVLRVGAGDARRFE
jgi:tRNA threonylcarbamoyl adenosine modification protein (Sua5/YciO/YrdC/YwlC family)